MAEARELAVREGVTLRTLVERGLRHVVGEAKWGEPFKLRRASFKGERLQPPMRDAASETLRDIAYGDGRGT